MAGSTVLNNFSQTPGPKGSEDNVLTLGGTVFQADGTQAANIIDPTGGATIDAQSRTAIIAILNLLENTGLMAGP